MKKKYDLSVKTGTTKEGKTIWAKVGVCMENDKGMFLLLDKTFNPAGVQDGKSAVMISMFEPRDKAQGAHNNIATQNAFGFDTDEPLPF